MLIRTVLVLHMASLAHRAARWRWPLQLAHPEATLLEPRSVQYRLAPPALLQSAARRYRCVRTVRYTRSTIRLTQIRLLRVSDHSAQTSESYLRLTLL